MKQLTKLAVAGAAALVLLMGIGAAGASATEFCSTNTSPCTGTMYGPGTKLSGKLTTGKVATLTNSLSNITCAQASMEGQMTTTGGAGLTPISGEVTSVTWASCITANGTACVAKVTGLPWKLTGEKTGETTFKVVVSNTPGVTVECGGLPTCTYSQTSMTLSGVNGSPARVTASAVGLNVSGGFLCPKSAAYDAEYDITAPNPLYAV
jgi:hypothetical protein